MKIFITTLIIFLALESYSQQWGEHIYEFLNVGSSARIESLGGSHTSILNSSSDFSFYNPSYLNATHHNQASINYNNYLAGINYGFVCYSRTYEGIGSFLIGIDYLNYGKFTSADIHGIQGHKFNAADYALILNWSRPVTDRLSAGINVKPIYSSLEKYTSLGISLDLAINYKSSNQLFTSSVVLRNLGYQLKAYYGSHRESLPLELSVGLSYKLEHAPILGVISYNNIGNSSSVSDNIVIGIELMPDSKFSLRGGYNIALRNNMKIEEQTSSTGFSWGFGFKLSQFKISYASRSYHIAGNSNIFSISSNISNLNF